MNSNYFQTWVDLEYRITTSTATAADTINEIYYFFLHSFSSYLINSGQWQYYGCEICCVTLQSTGNVAEETSEED